MNLQNIVFSRTATIASILIVLLSIGFHFYIRYDNSKFESGLPKIQTVADEQVAYAPNSEPIKASHGCGSCGGCDQTDANHNCEHGCGCGETALDEPKEEVEVAQCSMAAMNMGQMSMSDEKMGEMAKGEQSEATSESEDSEEPKLYAGLTNEQIRELVIELSSPDVEDANEKYDLLGEVLLDIHGPDPRIPQIIGSLKTIHVLEQIALGRTNDEEDVDNYLSRLPAVVANNYVELSIDFFGITGERADEMRQAAAEITKEVDTLKLLQDVRPLVQEAVDAGEISPEDGEAFIKSATDLNVTMHRKSHAPIANQTAPSVKNFSMSEDTPSSESFDLNVPEISGD